MLEADGVLRTWALAKLPRDWAALATGAIAASDDNLVAAEALGDHRLAYLDYEGPLTGDRGTVRRLDCGDLNFVENAADVCIAELAGCMIRGTIELRRSNGNWSLALR